MFSIYLTQYGGSILGPIAKVLGFVLSAIYSFLANFGIENAAVSIILFTFIVNLIMLPINVKQQKYSKMSSKMQPELAKIQEKYKGKTDNASMFAQQEEMKALYAKYGTSPTGGCLPSIITMFVFLGLYKVIYAIPAYVPQIKEIYEQVADIAMNNQDAMKYLSDNVKTLSVVTSGWGEDIPAALAGNVNYVIDVFTKFGRANWETFNTFFSGTEATTVTNLTNDIVSINGVFGGLNIAETPKNVLFPGIIIPIVSVILQYLQTHLMMKNSNMDPTNNPAAASMQMMNKIMPLTSGFFCLMFPIGAGIYLIASSAFRIVQQIFTDRYLDSLDVDEMIEKNLEKQKVKREKMHLEAYDGSIRNVATMRTNNISETDSKNLDTTADNNSSAVSYKTGSIASIAHMNMKEDSFKGEK